MDEASTAEKSARLLELIEAEHALSQQRKAIEEEMQSRNIQGDDGRRGAKKNVHDMITEVEDEEKKARTDNSPQARRLSWWEWLVQRFRGPRSEAAPAPGNAAQPNTGKQQRRPDEAEQKPAKEGVSADVNDLKSKLAAISKQQGELRTKINALCEIMDKELAEKEHLIKDLPPVPHGETKEQSVGRQATYAKVVERMRATRVIDDLDPNLSKEQQAAKDLRQHEEVKIAKAAAFFMTRDPKMAPKAAFARATEMRLQAREHDPLYAFMETKRRESVKPDDLSAQKGILEKGIADLRLKGILPLAGGKDDVAAAKDDIMAYDSHCVNSMISTAAPQILPGMHPPQELEQAVLKRWSAQRATDPVMQHLFSRHEDACIAANADLPEGGKLNPTAYPPIVSLVPEEERESVPTS